MVKEGFSMGRRLITTLRFRLQTQGTFWKLLELSFQVLVGGLLRLLVWQILHRRGKKVRERFQNNARGLDTPTGYR